MFLAGSADRIAVATHISYVTQIWILRVAVFVLPAAVYYLVRAICIELQERRARHIRRIRLVSSSTSSGRVPSTRISSPPSGSGSHLPSAASATISSAASRS